MLKSLPLRDKGRQLVHTGVMPVAYDVHVLLMKRQGGVSAVKFEFEEKILIDRPLRNLSSTSRTCCYKWTLHIFKKVKITVFNRQCAQIRLWSLAMSDRRSRILQCVTVNLRDGIFHLSCSTCRSPSQTEQVPQLNLRKFMRSSFEFAVQSRT